MNLKIIPLCGLAIVVSTFLALVLSLDRRDMRTEPKLGFLDSTSSQLSHDGPDDVARRYCAAARDGEFVVVKELVVRLPDEYILKRLNESGESLESAKLPNSFSEDLQVPEPAPLEQRIRGFRQAAERMMFDSVKNDYPDQINRFQFELVEVSKQKVDGNLAFLDVRLISKVETRLEVDWTFYLHKTNNEWKIFTIMETPLVEDFAN